MTYWIVDRLLPGLATGWILVSITYVKLHFEEKWPYWGRKKKDDDAKR